MVVPAGLVSCANCIFWEAWDNSEVEHLPLSFMEVAKAVAQSRADAINAAATKAAQVAADAATAAAQAASNAAAEAAATADPANPLPVVLVTVDPVPPTPIDPVEPEPVMGLCRIRAPEISEVGPNPAAVTDANIAMGAWRTTWLTDWCGEGKAKV